MARTGTGRRANRSRVSGKAPQKSDVPDVYREMLADAVSSSPTRQSREGRTIKRRRVGGRVVAQAADDAADYLSDQSSKLANETDVDELFEEPQPARQQVVQTESEDSTDSEMDWEEVDLRDSAKQEATTEHKNVESGDLNLVLGGDENKLHSHGRVKRKPITAAEKKLRLEIHKMHLCSLLVHVHLRNHWCNDENVHSVLISLLTRKTISYLNPDESKSQFQRSRSFMDGLEQTCDTFRGRFKITARGMSKPNWADSPETLALLQPPDDIDLPMLRSDIRSTASNLKASRDVGAQLFCALLRSAGVDARLVCSLLPLPFQPAQKVSLPQVMHHAPKQPDPRARKSTPEDSSDADVGSELSAFAEAKAGSTGGRSRIDTNIPSRLGRIIRSVTPEASTKRTAPQSKKRKSLRESKYPVYWVEAFNEAVQKWVPIDPLVTKSIAKPSKFKPSKFEPPAGEPENHMSYVVAFEDDGSARDVTRRYVKAYNAKTRRDRVEVTKEGARWWRRVMKMYRRPHELDRDQVEDAEFAAKEAAEPTPRNVQDFKDHPYYALERHLKRHEVINPKREVGKVGTGRSGSSNAVEPIYRRKDVHLVKSADSWYRMGREIKAGEQPLKRVTARRIREQTLDPDDLETADEDKAGTALYTASQTTLYLAPPVVNGQIPKNVYGNLDIYAPSMVPPGGAHLLHPETARAARIVGIDYADAVTGFLFKGRHGTAVTTGAVVAAEYREAVEEVIKSFEDDRARAVEERRSLEALNMWKRMLVGLRIRERIQGYEIEGERDTTMKDEMEKVSDDEDDDDDAGGFLPGRDGKEIAQPTAGRNLGHGLADLSEDEGGGFLLDESDEDSDNDAEVFKRRTADPFINKVEDDDGGGFLKDDGDEDAEEALQDMRVHELDQGSPESINAATKISAANDDEVGGGFMLDETTYIDQSVPEDDTTEDAEYSANKLPYLDNEDMASQQEPMQNEASKDEAFPDLRIGELEEARMLQQLYETGQMDQSTVGENIEILDPSEQSNGADARDQLSNASTRGRDLPSPEHGAMQDEVFEPDRSEEDKGSLISNDPDDEDADLEWFAE